MDVYPITPVPKPRMTQSVKWKRTPGQQRYFDFKDKVRDLGVVVPDCNYHVVFVLPMADSWTPKKKVRMDGSKHQQTPDKDNLEKALLDSVHKNDAHIWNGEVTKIWGREGQIIIAHRSEFKELCVMFPKAFDELVNTGVLIA